MSRPRTVDTEVVLRGGLGGDLVLAGADGARRTDLELDVLRLVRIERERVELLAAVLLGEGRIEFCGASADRFTTIFLPLSFLTARIYSKVVLAVPRSSGSCGLSVILAGRSFTSDTATGRVTVLVAPLAVTVRLVVPMGASLGTSRRSSSATLALVAGNAAAIGCPPPTSVAVQPCGAPETARLHPLRRQRVVLQPHIDGRGRARAQADGRIVGQKEYSFDVGFGGVLAACRRDNGKRCKDKRIEGDKTISHDPNSRAIDV